MLSDDEISVDSVYSDDLGDNLDLDNESKKKIGLQKKKKEPKTRGFSG